MFNKKKKNNKGFTLVELLVVIAIIGILAVVAVPSLMKNIDKAKSVQVVTNVNALKTEIMSKYADGKTYAEIADISDTVAPEEHSIEESILSIITDKKAGESYNLVLEDGVVKIAVSTTSASEVLYSAAQKLGLTDIVSATAKIKVPVIK